MELTSDNEIALEAVKCFLDDGTLDTEELNVLIGLALRDKEIDYKEKDVLESIFLLMRDCSVWGQTPCCFHQDISNIQHH